MLKIWEDEDYIDINKKIKNINELIETNEFKQMLYMFSHNGLRDKNLQYIHKNLISELGESIDERMKVVERIFN